MNSPSSGGESKLSDEKVLDLLISLLKNVRRQRQNDATAEELFEEVRRRMSLRGIHLELPELYEKWQQLRKLFLDKDSHGEVLPMEPELAKLFEEIDALQDDQESESPPEDPPPKRLKSQRIKPSSPAQSNGKAHQKPWGNKATKCFLDLLRIFKPKVGTTLFNKKSMWERITTEMQRQGFVFTTQQVINKWKGMARRYRLRQEQIQNGAQELCRTRFVDAFSVYADLFAAESAKGVHADNEEVLWNSSEIDESLPNENCDQESVFGEDNDLEMNLSDIMASGESGASTEKTPDKTKTIQSPSEAKKYADAKKLKKLQIDSYRKKKLELETQKLDLLREQLAAYKERTSEVVRVGENLTSIFAQLISKK